MYLRAVLSHLLHQGYQQLEAGMCGSQVTNTQTFHDPKFLEAHDCNKVTTHSETLSIFFCNFTRNHGFA
jgi:hypothetical protein